MIQAASATLTILRMGGGKIREDGHVMIAFKRTSIPLLAALALGFGSAGAQEFTLTAGSPTVPYNLATGEAEFSAPIILILEEAVPAGSDPAEIAGFSLSLAHSGAILSAVDATFGPAIQALNGGKGPDFFSVAFAPTSGDGVTCGMVFDFSGNATLTFEAPTSIVSVIYETVPSALIGDEAGVATELTWDETIGNPNVPNELVDVSPSTITPTLVNGIVTLTPFEGSLLRGDVDGTGVVNSLVDTLFLLYWQFNAGAVPPCMDAADCDDDGLVNALVDGLYVLAWQFSAGLAPPAPGTESCGADPTADAVECETPSPCD